MGSGGIKWYRVASGGIGRHQVALSGIGWHRKDREDREDRVVGGTVQSWHRRHQVVSVIR